ncbi:unnamed protein product [Musa acuminata subsp. burmannicoides]
MKPLFSSHIFDGNKQNKLNIRKLCVLNPNPPQLQPHPLRLLPHQGRLPGASHGPPRRPRQATSISPSAVSPRRTYRHAKSATPRASSSAPSCATSPRHSTSTSRSCTSTSAGLPIASTATLSRRSR